MLKILKLFFFIDKLFCVWNACAVEGERRCFVLNLYLHFFFLDSVCWDSDIYEAQGKLHT